MTFPVEATIVYSDGTRFPVSRDGTADLYDAIEGLVTRRVGIRHNDADEGADIRNKPLRYVGGRTEFERAVQRSMIRWLNENERPGLPRVLLIGDSIRMRIYNGTGYAMDAYRRLVGKANLTHIPHNCGGSRGVLRNLGDWLQDGPDLVHINTGLHDLAIHAENKPLPTHSPIPDHQENLRRIFRQIRASGAKTIIWALNTPVDDEWHATTSGGTTRTRLRRNSDVIAYNAASTEIAREFEIQVNDLYSPLVEAGVRKVLLPDGVHLNHLGSKICGKTVADAVTSAQCRL